LIKIHTSDGDTIRIDLGDESQAREWLARLKSHSFQSSIRGISIVESHGVRSKCRSCGAKITGDLGVQYSVSRPEAFRSVEYDIEHVPETGKLKGGERVVVYADDVRISTMVHRSQPAAKVTATKVGKRKFNP